MKTEVVAVIAAIVVAVLAWWVWWYYRSSSSPSAPVPSPSSAEPSSAPSSAPPSSSPAQPAASASTMTVGERLQGNQIPQLWELEAAPRNPTEQLIHRQLPTLDVLVSNGSLGITPILSNDLSPFNSLPPHVSKPILPDTRAVFVQGSDLTETDMQRINRGSPNYKL